MKWTILVENSVPTGSTCQGEAGLSMLLEVAGKKLLFDTGNSRLLLQNASRLGITLNDVEMIALSHGHGDHTTGLSSLAPLLNWEGNRIPVQMHPIALASRCDADGEMGFGVDRRVFEDAFSPRLSTQPVELCDRLIWLGEIPRKNAFEQRSCGIRDSEPDFLPDDTALVYRHPDGLVILTGCSHSGICNIVDYAVEITGEERVIDIVGGFHLPKSDDDYLAKVCEGLKKHQPKRLHPCHCTGLYAKIALCQVAPVEETCVGTVVEYD